MLRNTKIDINGIKHIIFDFDGVIAETDYGRFEVLSKILTKYDIDFKNRFHIEDISGTPTDIFLNKHFPNLGAFQIETIVKKRKEEYINNIDKYCNVYPGSVETLNDFFNLGYIIYLATTNNAFIATKLTDYAGISDLFHSVFPREKIINKEYNKKDYDLLLSETNINPIESIVIEDSLTGLKSAKENKVACIGFNRFGNKKIDEISDFSVNSYNELRRIFGLEDTIL